MIPKHDKLLANFAFNCNLRPSIEDLRARLTLLPAAIVGEIGLDRVCVPMNDGVKVGEPDYANQLDCFNAQLALAAELGGAVQVDPGFSQLTPGLLSVLETNI